MEKDEMETSTNKSGNLGNKELMVTDLDDPIQEDGKKDSIGKLSVEQLIKNQHQQQTGEELTSVSAKSSVKELKLKNQTSAVFDNDVIWLGVLHVFFGFLMMGFAVYAILHEAAMSLIASGVWTGLVAISTGVFGVLATATRCCPVEDKWRKTSRTLFLALSLVSLALSQLVVVMTGIGLARDLNNTENEEQNPNYEEINSSEESSKFALVIPENYYGILANVALIIVASLECICALISSYKGAKVICPCFKKENILYTGLPVNNSHALVSSWLGKHSPPPQLYVVTSGSNKGGKIPGGLPITPVFTYPPQMMGPQIVGVPLIPAPLGTIPSPIIPNSRKYPHVYNKHHQKFKHAIRPIEKTPRPSRSRSRSRSKTREGSITEKDVQKTYTGLDKEIAEQFIEKCDSKRVKNSNSISSKTSCANSSASSGPVAGSSGESTTNSKDCLIK